MIIDRDVNFAVQEDAIIIENAFGFADFNQKYKIFNLEAINNLIEFIDKCRSTPLRDNLPPAVIQEINGRYVSFVTMQEDIMFVINKDKVIENNLQDKQLVFKHDGLDVSSIKI